MISRDSATFRVFRVPNSVFQIGIPGGIPAANGTHNKFRVTAEVSGLRLRVSGRRVSGLGFLD